MNELKGIPHIVTIRFKIVVMQNGVLGQLPPRQIAPNPKTNCNPNRIGGGDGGEGGGGAIFLGGNCPDTAEQFPFRVTLRSYLSD